MSDTYAFYPVFKANPDVMEGEVPELTAEVEELFSDWEDRVHVRGMYSTVGFRPDSDVMMWWVGSSADDLQQMLVELYATDFGGGLEMTWSFMGVHRPPEIAKDHIPAFMSGHDPKKYLNVYPFVRTPEWYLLPDGERGELLREHGGAGREFPGVLANTTSGFGLGDWEWILAFEADELTEIVDCIRKLRDTKARLYT
ncbi:MAG: chlorite dismutase family protein, partial [Actinobacteria bacterium]|nr:chlorite dismutase family protein [Actinomycetota bacterium]